MDDFIARFDARIQQYGEDGTWVSLAMDDGERVRFCVTGSSAPYEITYLHEFGPRAKNRSAWFPIGSATPQGVYDLLVQIHERELAVRGALV